MKNPSLRIQNIAPSLTVAVDSLAKKLKAEGKTQIDGTTAFTFYDTYGFPIDLTQDMAEEAGMTVDSQGFKRQHSLTGGIGYINIAIVTPALHRHRR